MNKKVYLYVNNTKEGALVLSENVKRSLVSFGYIVLNDINPKPDIVIGFGGDGTLIKWLITNNYNIDSKYIGVNCGTLGFMKDFDVMDVKEFVNNIPKYVEQNLDLVEIKIETGNKIYTHYALNEFYIKTKNDMALRVGIKISDILLENFVGTGLNFSTPTGSTARNLSSGGSIVFPSLHVLEMTPSEANSFLGALSKSMIIPKENVITLFPISNDEIKILADAENIYIGNVDKITISLSSRKLTKLIDKNMSFVSKIHNKLIRF